MIRIADDEISHAELAWDVARWLEPRLTPRARTRLTTARRRALRALARDASSSPPHAAQIALGLPSAAESLAALRALATNLWGQEL